MRDHSKPNFRLTVKRPTGIVAVKDLLDHAQRLAEIRKHILENYYDDPHVLRKIIEMLEPRIK